MNKREYRQVKSIQRLIDRERRGRAWTMGVGMDILLPANTQEHKILENFPNKSQKGKI